MTHFTKVVLYTDTDGRARFREEQVPLTEGTAESRVFGFLESGGYQLRASPVGFRSQPHCSPHAQWVFILSGRMEIGLADGSSRLGKARIQTERKLKLVEGRPCVRAYLFGHRFQVEPISLEIARWWPA